MSVGARDYLADPVVVARNSGVDKVVIAPARADGKDFVYLNVGDGYRNDGDILLDQEQLEAVVKGLLAAGAVFRK